VWKPRPRATGTARRIAAVTEPFDLSVAGAGTELDPHFSVPCFAMNVPEICMTAKRLDRGGAPRIGSRPHNSLSSGDLPPVAETTEDTRSPNTRQRKAALSPMNFAAAWR